MSTAIELEFPPNYVPEFRARHRQIYKLLQSLLPEDELIVDVGAGFAELGRIVVAARKHRYIGFEPSRSVAAQAAARGIDLRPEFFTTDSLAEPAGAVVLDNVIEHVVDPIGLLKTCVHALRPGGILVVIVPNRGDIRSLLPSWAKTNHWIPPHHINYFTPRTLATALESFGVEAHPFGFAAVGYRDYKYWPRALLEVVGVYPFGLNVFGSRPLQ